ncbi:MAG: hypothetical protein ABID87_07190, partial [Chloroflexota bacterium]
ELEVLNPEAEYEKPVHGAAPRLKDLDGKKIGLFWNGKLNGDKLLQAVGSLLRERVPSVELVRYNLTISVGADNVKRMAEECDGIIAAIGD